MRLALISDVHANLISLEAVLADIEAQGADATICLGDLALTGPQPHQVIERLATLDYPTVMGNCDAWLLDPRPSEEADEHSKLIEEIDYWCLEQLSFEGSLTYLRTLRPTIETPLAEGASLLCFHGSPRDNMEIIVATTPDQELEEMLAGSHAEVMAGGHIHQPLLRRHRDTFIVNPGSVGLPYLRARRSGEIRTPAWAEYALLTWEGGSLSVAFRRVPVDAGGIRDVALNSGMPNAEWWAESWK